MKFFFEVRVRGNFVHLPGENQSALSSIDYNLTPSPNLNADRYVDPVEDLPTQEGHRIAASLLSQAIAANIQVRNKLYGEDIDVTLDWFIKEMKRGLEHSERVAKGSFSDNDLDPTDFVNNSPEEN